VAGSSLLQRKWHTGFLLAVFNQRFDFDFMAIFQFHVSARAAQDSHLGRLIGWRMWHDSFSILTGLALRSGSQF